MFNILLRLRWIKASDRVLGEIEARHPSRTRLADRLLAIGQLESLCTLLTWVLAWQLVEHDEVSDPAEVLSRRVRISMAKAVGTLDDAAALSKMPGLLPMFEEGRVSPNQVVVLVELRRMLSGQGSTFPLLTTARHHMPVTVRGSGNSGVTALPSDLPRFATS